MSRVQGFKGKCFKFKIVRSSRNWGARYRITCMKYKNILVCECVVLLSFFFMSRKPRLAPQKQTSYETRAETTERNFHPSAEELRLVDCNTNISITGMLEMSNTGPNSVHEVVSRSVCFFHWMGCLSHTS